MSPPTSPAEQSRPASPDLPPTVGTHDRPWRLRVEHLDRALGIAEWTPRLSWRLPDGARTQRGHQLRIRLVGADEVDLGMLSGSDHLLVPWPLDPLPSRAFVAWQVRVETDLGTSPWSEPSAFETGLAAGDWRADWIGPVEQLRPAPGTRPGYLLRSRFDLPAPASGARAYVSAHGIYELFVNGVRVGDTELTPGYTSYRRNLAYQTYDVTDRLRPGANVIGVLLSDGWYRGRVGYYRQPDAFGADVAALVQLEVHTDAEPVEVVSGADWEVATGSVVAADLMDGQTIDLARARPGWSAPGDPSGGWRPVAVRSGDAYGLDRLTTSPAPPVRVIQELTARALTEPVPGRLVADFGQNLNGRVRVRGVDGRNLVLEHGEALGPDGDMTNDHLAGHDHRTHEPMPVGMRDEVRGGSAVFGSTRELGFADGEVAFRHTTHGFRWVRLTGDTAGLRAEDLTAQVVHTDLVRTGWFACSDERLNRLHDAAVWSFRGNACDIPTDCPHRERAGWTGDWQLYVPTAAYLYDVAGFSVKWLRDLVADQRDDGTILNFAPEPNAAPGGVDVLEPPWDRMQGSSGWAEAIVIVPWELYRAYGDAGVLRETYPAMVSWVEHCRMQAATRRHPAMVAHRPQPLPHETYLWDTGYHWGEWLEPAPEPASNRFDPFAEEGVVATAYFYRAADLMSRIAGVLGQTTDAQRYRELAEQVRDAWRTEYALPGGRLARDTQATYARALTFGLVPEGDEQAAADRLAALVRGNGTHLSTGFLATPMLLPRLAEGGHEDVAFDLLRSDTVPSWLVMIDRGATTIWESWEGLHEDGTPEHSLNHYSKGAVVSFLHAHVAGLRMDDRGVGYERFLVEPHPGGGLSWARAVLDSPHGRIEAGWEVAGHTLTVRVSVPPGTSACVRLPGGEASEVGPGEHVRTAAGFTRGSAKHRG